VTDQSAIARNALFKAISLAEGIGNLSRELSIRQKDLLEFASGEAPIPQPVFLQLVDYLLDERHAAKLHASDAKPEGKSDPA
jgi:hypothetical protein